MSYNIAMIKKFSYDFSPDKNRQLIKERGVSFEDVIAALDQGQLIDIIDHPNIDQYAHQKIYVIDINNYIYLIPFVYKNFEEVFLKTIFPSRKLTKQYRKKQK
ncbi:MAG: hypothetical protein ACRYGR_06365 [Janthinobacterium lividum]